MRITNKIMQNNSLSNININKIMQDKLNNQMSTEKKINRPSEDPVIAIRALRLRTNVSQVTQYYERNVPDAASWMKVTEDALTTVSGVVTDMIEQCQKGANEKLTSTDRNTILDALVQLKEEVYATGNADYAGRCVFTGYRTDDTLKFTANTTKEYEIIEQVDNTRIDSITYIDTGDLNSLNDTNFNNATNQNITELGVTSKEIHRIRLSYLDLDNEAPILTTYDTMTKTFIPVTSNPTQVVSKNATPNPYMNVGDDDVILVKETGELLIGENVYKQLMEKEDNPLTDADESEIRVTYQKINWEKDDLKPEHYFACKDITDPANEIEYNYDYLKGIKEKQAIEYDVGLNQTIRVNTTAEEVFRHSIGRDVDDLISAMQETIDMEGTVSKLDKLIKSGKYSGNDLKYLNNQLDASNKALTFLKERTQKLFEGGISKMQGHLDTVNYATTNSGTRSKKLELIENRLMSQKTNFETLQSDNENADITDVAIQLKGAELTYQAALMATGKIMQTSLMNYI